MESHLLGSLIALLCIACAVALVVRILKQPYSIALVLVGLVIALLKLTPAISISHDVIFLLILPPLLFQGALHMNLGHLKENWKSICLLSIPGVLASTFLIGFLMHLLLGLELKVALLFGALITPTDPISVLSILKKVGAPQRLRTILEGESLFNDGTGVVIFSIILGMVLENASFQLSATFIDFVKVVGGGILIGGLMGLIVFQVMKRIDDHLIEVALTVVLTFGAPLIAETFHFSGIMAVVVAGLIVGNYGRVYSMSEKTRETIENFWEVIDFIINSILFLVIGIELQVVQTSDFHLMAVSIACVIGILLVSRGLVVYPVVWIKNKISSNSIPKGWNHVLFWGGLKGSLSIALVVGLPASFASRDYLLVLAFSVVLFSLVIQGLTMKPLLNALKLTE